MWQLLLHTNAPSRITDWNTHTSACSFRFVILSHSSSHFPTAHIVSMPTRSFPMVEFYPQDERGGQEEDVPRPKELSPAARGAIAVKQDHKSK